MADELEKKVEDCVLIAIGNHYINSYDGKREKRQLTEEYHVPSGHYNASCYITEFFLELEYTCYKLV